MKVSNELYTNLGREAIQMSSQQNLGSDDGGVMFLLDGLEDDDERRNTQRQDGKLQAPHDVVSPHFASSEVDDAQDRTHDKEAHLA